MEKDLTLVVSSCDKYSDAWAPYFTLLKMYFPKIEQYPIVLSTEKKSFNGKELGLNIRTFNDSRSSTWSERLIKCLESIDTNYILFNLEDFFLQKTVDIEEIEKCLTWMKESNDIAVFYFMKVLDSYKESPYKHYFEVTPELKYRLNAQVGLWNRSALLSFLDKNENPWEFEIEGSKRIQHTTYKLYCHKFADKCYNLDGPFPYMMGWQNGYGISQGKWLWNNKRLFYKNGIRVDFTGLGVCKKYEYNIGFYSKIRNTFFPPLVKIRDRMLRR